MNTQLLKARIIDFLTDEEGLTTVEYAIAGSLVGAAVVLSFENLGDAVNTVIVGLTAAIS